MGIPTMGGGDGGQQGEHTSLAAAPGVWRAPAAVLGGGLQQPGLVSTVKHASRPGTAKTFGAQQVPRPTSGGVPQASAHCLHCCNAALLLNSSSSSRRQLLQW